MAIRVPWQAWYGETEQELTFPDGWQVRLAHMADAPPASEDMILEALQRPIGAPPLRELAQGSQKAVIVVEDITRPLDTAAILPAILSELAAGGIRGDDVWITMGLGAHTPMNRPDLIKKLGKSVVEHYAVYQNQPYENLAYLGDTQRGTPVYISRFYLDADLRISLGTVTPHPYAGFGSGAKTVAVGVAGIDTLFANHGRAYSSGLPTTGKLDGNDCRDDMEEIARMAGLSFAINGVINSRRQLVGLFAGHQVQAHRAAADLARRVSATELPPPADVVVFNAYPKDTNLIQSINSLNAAGYDLSRVLKADGTAVLTTAAPEGIGIIYLESVGMRLYLKLSREMMGLGKHGAIVFSPNLSYPEVRTFYPDDTLVYNQWPQVERELLARHGKRAWVTVFPCGAIQIPAG
ncbi:MAG: nickel-dependent lactate racemase [Chloroflexota bacterium]